MDQHLKMEEESYQYKPSMKEELPEDHEINNNYVTCNVGAEEKQKNKHGLMYTVEDTPPWYLCILLGLQHYLTMIASTMSVPLILSPFFCLEDKDPARGYLVCTIIFVSGIVTLLQTCLGVRLPIVQGGTFTFLSPTIAILTLEKFRCPDNLEEMSADEKEEVWQIRIREVQGAIAASALFQVFCGFTGLFGFFLRWVGPLTIAPMITSIGLSLIDSTVDKVSSNWGIAIMSLSLVILFSQYLANFDVPFPYYIRKDRKVRFAKLPIFKLFPVLLAIMISWIVCLILTETDVFDKDNSARTDRFITILHDSPWFRFPYPGQWGAPTISVASVFGMLAGVLASAVESIGDYYACARLSGAPPPPIHAVNRGLLIEGIGCILAGVWGTGNGTTSYSENIGAIGVTKVGSRRVVQVGGIICIIVGLIGKFGALCVTIPDPVIGGVFCITFSLVTAMGLSVTQFIDMNSPRNLFILGFSIFIGLVIPEWLNRPGNEDVISTGNITLDQIIVVLLKTNMFIAGVLGFVLDNTIPGTPEERGIIKFNETSHKNEEDGSSSTDCYNLPSALKILQRPKWTRFIPICPTYDIKSLFKTKKKVEKREEQEDMRKQQDLYK